MQTSSIKRQPGEGCGEASGVGAGLVAVVIPYYQREAGILARALRSVSAQDWPRERLRVYVVDDGSPQPAARELAQVPEIADRVCLIQQRNAGPGAARNAALDRMDSDVVWIAFLDSDDEWMPDHLSKAILALSQGYDAYFADFYQLDQQVSAFSRAGRIDPLRHLALPYGESLFEYVGDMTRQILTGNVIGTSTVVLRQGTIAEVRFRNEYRRAGEDYLFWLALAQRGARFCFGARPSVRCGRGVNVYSGARWGTAAFTATAQDELRFKLACLRELDVAEDLRHHLMRDVERLRDAWVAGCLHRVLRLRPMPLREVLRQRRLDPRLWQRLARALAAKVGLGRSSPN